MYMCNGLPSFYFYKILSLKCRLIYSSVRKQQEPVTYDVSYVPYTSPTKLSLPSQPFVHVTNIHLDTVLKSTIFTCTSVSTKPVQCTLLTVFSHQILIITDLFVFTDSIQSPLPQTYFLHDTKNQANCWVYTGKIKLYCFSLCARTFLLYMTKNS